MVLMTLVGFEPGPPGQKSNAQPLSQRIYSLMQLSEIVYKLICFRRRIKPFSA